MVTDNIIPLAVEFFLLPSNWHVEHFEEKYNALHSALCYHRVCLCVGLCVCLSVCVCVCVLCLWSSGKRFEIETSFFFKLRGITPDIISKNLTQIRLQISRWRTKCRPFNTIIGCNSAIY